MIAPTTGDGLKISAWAIRNPIPVTVLFLALLLAGVLSYLQLPIKQYPNVQLPMVSVTVTQNGASPGEIETQITRQVEDAVAGVSNVENVQSVVTQGASTTNITFHMTVARSPLAAPAMSKSASTTLSLTSTSNTRSPLA